MRLKQKNTKKPENYLAGIYIFCRLKSQGLWVGLWCLTSFYQYFSYIVAVSWWGKSKYPEKITDQPHVKE
jgi:hypothetical protein